MSESMWKGKYISNLSRKELAEAFYSVSRELNRERSIREQTESMLTNEARPRGSWVNGWLALIIFFICLTAETIVRMVYN